MKIVNGILQDVNIDGIKFVVDIIPKGRKRRPAIPMNPKYITIHNTGGENVKADNYRRCQLDVTQDKEVSWQIVLDESLIVQSLPINEVAWHAGNRNGNYTSFGIEVCERKGAEEVAVKFVAELLKALNMTTDNVKPHKYWSGKQCAWKILPHWDKFILNIKDAMSGKVVPIVKPQPVPTPKYTITKTKVSICGYVKIVDAININGFNYCKMRDLENDKFVLDYREGTIYINNKPFNKPECIMIDAYNYVKLQSLVSAGFKVVYDNVNKIPVISV